MERSARKEIDIERLWTIRDVAVRIGLAVDTVRCLPDKAGSWLCADRISRPVPIPDYWDQFANRFESGYTSDGSIRSTHLPEPDDSNPDSEENDMGG